MKGLFLVAFAALSALEHYQIASKAFMEKKFDAAVEALEKSLEMEPKQLGATRLLGLSYQLLGRFAEAEAAFQSACRLAPKDGESWFYLGRLYYVGNYFDKARPVLETAARLSPDDARIHESLALTLEAAGEPEAAEREYRLALRGKQASVRLNYGALLLKLNRASEAEPLLEKADPKLWQTRFELAKLYVQTSRYERALKELKAALGCAATPEEAARTHGLMANVYTRLGRHEEAARSAEAAQR